MFGWLLGIDIMGGDITPPDDMPIHSNKIDTTTILGAVLLIILLLISLILIVDQIKKLLKKPNRENQTKFSRWNMNNENLICPICGEPTNVYMGNARRDRLCRKHGSLANKGEIIQCEDCGKWNNAGEACPCKAPKTVVPESSKESDASELTCFFCKGPSNGKHFCKDCYFKYKDREIDVHITHLCDWKITDEYGNQKIQCKNGMKVRSRAEKIIADFFFDHSIRVIYETDIPYSYNGKTIILNPDFFLPDFGEIGENGKKKGIIIEYNELETNSYKKKKNFTKKGYEELGLEVIVLSTEDINNDLLQLKVRFNVF